MAIFRVLINRLTIQMASFQVLIHRLTIHVQMPTVVISSVISYVSVFFQYFPITVQNHVIQDFLRYKVQDILAVIL